MGESYGLGVPTRGLEGDPDHGGEPQHLRLWFALGVGPERERGLERPRRGDRGVEEGRGLDPVGDVTEQATVFRADLVDLGLCPAGARLGEVIGTLVRQ